MGDDLTSAETVAQRTIEREGMPTPLDIGDGMGLSGAAGQTRLWCETYNVPFPTTEAQAAANLLVWMAKTHLLALVTLSLPLGDAICDWAYNSDVRAAVRGLQGILGVSVDGILGPQTLGAVGVLTEPERAALVRDVAIARVKFLGAGLTHGTIKADFALGLLTRAVSFL